MEVVNIYDLQVSVIKLRFFLVVPVVLIMLCTRSSRL